MALSPTGLVAKTLLLAVAYYLSARLGLLLQFADTQASPVWPPSGLAFAAVLLFGAWTGGGIFLGEFLANLVDLYVKTTADPQLGQIGFLSYVITHPAHLLASAVMGFGNMLEALAGAAIVRRVVARPDVSGTIPNAFTFLLAALACCLVDATIGVSALFAAGLLPYSLLSTVWFTWWLGDVCGIWIITPLVLAWSPSRAGAPPRRPAPWTRIALALVLVSLFGQLTFNGWLEQLLSGTQVGGLVAVLLRTQAHLLIPLLLWIEFRFGNRAGTLGIAIVTVIAILGTLAGHGPFAATPGGASQNEALLALQGFIGVTASAMLLLNAALRERRRAHDQLEQRVAERTTELREANHALSLEIRERKQALVQLERETADRRRAEEVLQQSQKMEAIGLLTGGVAHDFNNLLTVILGTIGIADGLAAGNERLKRLLNSARRAAERGAGLTKDLLAFSRRQPLRPEVVHPSESLRGACNLLQRSLRSDIELEVDLPNEVRAIEVDPTQLELALLNIGLNARDAMPDGGRLRIATCNATLGGEHDLRGDYVAITISDTGVGIPDELHAKVFEPFFTTKEVGKGSGLGLSQAYGFAKQSGGALALESTVGHGTTITLYLPPAAGAPSPAPPASLVSVIPHIGHGTVLVVEDDEDVAELAASLIEASGYTVRTAPNARVALELLRTGDAVDLVFSDIVMPGGMNGVELGRAVRAHFPRTAVLLATGFSEAAAGAEARGFALITKPYHARELTSSIGRLIAEARPHADGVQEPAG